MSSIIAHGRRNFKSALTCSTQLRNLLDDERIERCCRATGHRWRASFWSPATTLLTFLLQTAHPVKSLRAAVAELLAHVLTQRRDAALPSADPSAFAQARQRLPIQVIAHVFDESAAQVRTMAGAENRWRGWRVIVIDGSSVSMPDTPELQNVFPQHGQQPGCGFPHANIVTLFDWRSGAALDYRMSSLHDSEASLFRSMLHHFTTGVVALADRYYCSYVDIARILRQGGDVVFRLHQRRAHDFRTGAGGARLDVDDTLVTWHRPKWIPSFGISREELDRLPEQLTLRMTRTTKTPHGFRSREIVIVTSVLDPQEATRDDLLALYRDRWLAELNIRSLKSTLGMEVLRGRSVDVVRKEVLMHLLLYNLIRLLMWEAARVTGRDPQRLSFAGTLHRLQSLGVCVLSGNGIRHARHDVVLTTLQRWIASDVVPDRPDRFEPRRVKRRPKNYSRLTKPRAHYHIHGDHSCR